MSIIHGSYNGAPYPLKVDSSGVLATGRGARVDSSASFTATSGSTEVTVPDNAMFMSVQIPAVTGTPTITLQGTLDDQTWATVYGKSGDETSPWQWASTSGSLLSPLVVLGAVYKVRFDSSAVMTTTITVSFK